MSQFQTFLEEYTEKHGILKTLDDFKLQKDTKVYREFASKLSGSYSLIDSFDHWVDNIFKLQVEGQSFTASDGTRIDFSNPEIHKPVLIVDNKEIPLYPQYCRDNFHHYLGRISITCNLTKTNGEKIKTNFFHTNQTYILLQQPKSK